LSYGKEDQMLFIDNELIKALETLSVVVSSLNFLEDISCQRIRCSGWALLLICVGLIVIGKKIWHPDILYEIIVKYFHVFLVSSPNYSWFMQHMENDSGDVGSPQLLLNMNFELYQLFKNHFICFHNSSLN
jgi:hypothetical protein